MKVVLHNLSRSRRESPQSTRSFICLRKVKFCFAQLVPHQAGAGTEIFYYIRENRFHQFHPRPIMLRIKKICQLQTSCG